MNKRRFLTTLLIASFVLPAAAQTVEGNLAIVASASGSGRNGGVLPTLNDGETPTPPGNPRYPRPPRQANQWVQYEWQQPVTTKQMAVHWWDFNHLAKLPANYHIEYWDGTAFQPVHNASGLGLENEKFNTTTFDEITTTRLRVVMDSSDRYSST